MIRTNRVDALADGIFAIVMTLLVFELRIPEYLSLADISNKDLWLELTELLPSFLSFLLSFTLLFTYWRAHHFFVSVYAKNIDTTLMNINAIFFMLVSLIPFSSTFLGEFSHNELAVIVFGVHVILIGLCLYWMRSYVFYSEHIINPEISKHEIHGSTTRTLVPVLSAIIAIPLAYFSIKMSIFLFTLAVIFNLMPQSTRLWNKLLRKLKVIPENWEKEY